MDATEDTIIVRTVRRSDSIAQLAAALAAAQGAIEGASKGKVNPHFKSAYADLSSVWDACREALSKNGLAVIQPPSAHGPRVVVTTILAHKSGEWIEGELEMTASQNTPQGIGSCITYARRYALAAMVGVAPEDDDGNAASHPAGRPTQTAQKAETQKPDGYDAWMKALVGTADKGSEALKQFWLSSRPEHRSHLIATNTDGWEDLKAHAASAQSSEVA